MFLRDAWYVAAWDRDVRSIPVPVQVLGDRIVLFRTAAGAPVALEDACPHRKLPLSMGRIQGDGIECGYHGLTFDAAGRCIRMPGVVKIPPLAKVRSYPAVSRFGLIWIWMGAAHEADPARIFEVEHADDPDWGRNHGGTLTMDCNYLFVTDNLLDPSHVSWVHQTSFGNAGTDDAPVDVSVAADGVTAARWLHDTEVAPFYRSLVTFEGRCDRLQQYEVRFPSHALVKAVFCPAGTGGKGRALHPDALVMDSYNFITPVDAHRSRYFWFQIRNRHAADAAVSRALDEGVRAAFDEDRVILAAVAQGFGNQVTPHIDLGTDRAPLLFRRRLAQMIAAEQQAAPAQAPRYTSPPNA